MFFTYVLYSKTYDQIYIGQSNNLNLRLKKHNSGRVKSTKPYSPWKLIYSESFHTRSEAMKREKELKSFQGRQFIRREILSSVD
ncbi:MAG: GIY-YIG nuclease family protein [Candidatus Marinimicrobia bacterium]|jgi:putative endonuclease|nr:GIY-YIG nuclease family protein [Candidatus Neomarinimicrobiota bacterium]MDP6936930.1 GIY-YIG nuclease family protein [Candidatus Neomarinimicrobiota bacterium]